MREKERELGFGEENLKARKRKHNGKSTKEKFRLVAANPSPMVVVDVDSIDGNGCNPDRIGELIADLVMWSDVAKSSLWFGSGSFFFSSSCFAGDIFAIISQLGLHFMCISFFSNSLSPRDNDEKRREFVLTDDDMSRVGRSVLPAANLAISKIRELFSGKPSMTLKVPPQLLLGAEHGHHITLWRLFACELMKVPSGITAANMKWRVFETLGACSDKKIVAASAIMAFWNLSPVKTRVFTAFISLAVLGYYGQHHAEEDKLEQKKEEKALVVVAGVESSQVAI
ncbi:Reticulon [Dillenia turbinata]|uniref:Reticulon n=1 Tax=Dillenia turbinata TaxID=194707 RepID=A0AAN8V274_9MAGN